jgi:osmoprotectant transport system ATP-binding protein
VVTLNQVSKSFDEVVALDNVSLEVSVGETIVLIGPSGCGKSTLLRTVNGLVTPDVGTVVVDDTELSQESVRAIRHKIGYSIQGGGLFPHLTARGNVSLLAKHLGRTRHEVDRRMKVVSEMARFPTSRLDSYPDQLSGGQRQRVALMRALMLDPPILLLDEPLGALDPMIRAELQDELKAIIAPLGKTVIFVTHDLPEAAFFADTIVLMREGKTVQSGTFEDLVQRPADAFVKAFIAAQQSLSFRS